MRKCKICKYGDSPCDWCVHDPDGELNFEPRPDAIDSLAYENERLEAENAALRVKLQKPANAPLTLDELRQMEGQPIWIECLTAKNYSCWGYTSSCGGIGYQGNFYPKDYGEAWLAYSRKPEE